MVKSIKLRRYTYCTKVGKDGCVNTEGAEHADAGWMHWCPGCEEMHAIAVEHPFPNGAKWTFDGNMLQPTFGPSIKIDYQMAGKPIVCHYFIHNGMIKFCEDSTHALSGQNVPLPDVPKYIAADDAT